MESVWQRIQRSGIKGASSVDLITLALSDSEAQLSGKEESAKQLMRSINNIQRLAELATVDLSEYLSDGYQCQRILAAIELGRRSQAAGKGEPTQIDGPNDVFALVRSRLENQKQEHFLILLLDAKNFVLKISTIHIGTLTSSVVGAREVFREAIREGASSIILVHNHPSGDPTPSPEDIRLTKQLIELGFTLDIPVHDHIIVGFNEYRSFANLGIMG